MLRAERTLFAGMRTKPISVTRRLALRAKVSQAAAADTVDVVVHEILRKLRAGKPAQLPGVGTLRRGAGDDIRFEQAGKRK